jgi:hypothetical protein
LVFAILEWGRSDHLWCLTLPSPKKKRIVAKMEQLTTLVDASETQLATARSNAEALLTAAVTELTKS